MQALRIIAAAALLAMASLAYTAMALAQAAPNAEAMQAARELVAIVTKDTMRQLASQVTAQVWPQIEQALRAKQPAITDAQLTVLRTEYERIQVEFMANVMVDAPAIYARHFTTAELRELLAFYHSPVGAKALRVLPQVMSEAIGLILPKMQQLQAQVMHAFTEVLKQRGFSI